jgi:hypothetical protein
MVDLINDEIESIIGEEEELSDAKLSTKKRKSLPSSSFCGPNRSFPVNDCAHVVAARRLIGRYKGPGSKTAILACVARKAKTLGCPIKKDNQDSQNEEKDSFVLESLSDSDLAQTLLDVEKLMNQRNLRAERKCDSCEEKDAKLVDFETQMPELQDTVKVLRNEYKIVLDEHSASEDSHSDTLTKFQASLQKSVLTSLLLTDKETSPEDLEVKVRSLALADLQKTAEETDLSEIISFVRSGLSRKPEENVTQDEVVPESEEKVSPYRDISESLINLQNKHGKRYAITCMASWIKNGKLPEDFTLDKAFELMAE